MTDQCDQCGCPLTDDYGDHAGHKGTSFYGEACIAHLKLQMQILEARVVAYYTHTSSERCPHCSKPGLMTFHNVGVECPLRMAKTMNTCNTAVLLCHDVVAATYAPPEDQSRELHCDLPHPHAGPHHAEGWQWENGRIWRTPEAGNKK